MQHRGIAWALAVTVTSLSGLALATMSGSTARAADECLAAPKGATPAGAHWYYRVEKGTKRKCWYLADEAARAGKTAAAAGDATTAAAAPAKPKAKAARTATVENARAELTTPDEDQPTLAETTWPPMPEQRQQATSPAAGDPSSAADAAANAPGDAAVAARWPANNTTSAQIAQAAAPAPRMQVAAATPAPTAAATDRAAPTTQAAHDDVLSPFRILLIGVTLALALLAVLVSVLFKYVWRRRTAAAPANGRPMWDIATPTIDGPRDHRVRSQPARPSGAPASRAPRHGIAPERDDRIDEIEALLRSTRDQTA